MSKICHTHCPDESLGLGVLVLVAAAVAAGLAVILFVIAHAAVLALGLAGVAVATFALYRFALRFVVVTIWRPLPGRPALQAAPAKPSQPITAPQRRAIEAPRTSLATITITTAEIRCSPSSSSS